MSTFRTVNLTRHFNATGKPRSRLWDKSAQERWRHLPRGAQQFWGIPFRLGAKDLSRKGLIVLDRAGTEVAVPLRGTATHLCVLHFSDASKRVELVGEHLADYTVQYADGGEHTQPIRTRFEIHPFVGAWGGAAYAAAGAHMTRVAPEDMAGKAWGMYQTGVAGQPVQCASWVYALENPRPEAALAGLVLKPTGKRAIAILGLTLYEGPGHPLRHVPRRIYRLLLPPEAKAKASDVSASLDMGHVTRLYAVPAKPDQRWLDSPERGLGTARAEDKPTREFLLHATGAEGATLSVQSGRKQYSIPFGEAFDTGKAGSTKGKARLQLLHPRTTWMHVTVVDDATGKPTPTRIRFCGSHGEYLPPYGHHEVVNDRWFEDYGGDLQLGGASFAYVPGRFQIELPVGEVCCEASKGFEYEPVRRKIEIKPGQRELELRIQRAADWRQSGWITADTHVHFISPQTAWLEGQGEGLNLINLLASQWGKLFTNVADITGEASGCSTEDTIVWVGTENRHHLLGHISMLGTHGDPVFPMCAGGPHEAYLGDPDVTTLTEWAETCRRREGVVIRPHFPFPTCEEPVYFALGQLDGVELRRYADPASGSLDEFCFKEWYRYLNCGYRVAAVGGTDKMSAGMPVGGARTYARLASDDGFSFDSWGKAVRAGRTFTTSGPLITLKVEGREVGDEIQLPSTGGTVEVEAEATSIWPIHLLEVVANERVVASADDKRGTHRLALKAKVPVKRSSWIAARCGSRLRVHHCWPIQLGAHTSPVYVICGGQEMFSAADAAYMLTLIDGGLTYLDTMSVRYDEARHRQMKAVFGRARRELETRLHGHSHG
ncbi:MAG: CehA/McbA family metallohydrolase [Armatimonadota bacterium]|nr:MAG: CehA/McbA family metallohydrolase [Armatimonadota bacterium]